MNRQRLFVVLGILLAYGILQLTCHLYFISTGVRWFLDDGKAHRFLLKSDISTRLESYDASLASTNITGWLRGYTVLNGRLVSQGYYVCGQAEGVVSNWYRSGVLRTLDSYSKGVHFGNSVMFFNNGQTQQCVHYVSGEATSARSWYKNGTPKAEWERREDGSRHHKTWNRQGLLVEDCWLDANCRATSGIACISWNPTSKNPPVLLDAVGRTNISLRAAISLLNP